MDKRRAIIDLELAFDVWSLLFSVTRQVLMNSVKVTLCNNDYVLILNKPVAEALETIKKTYLLSEYTTNVIKETFEKHVPSVKPWLPFH